MRTTLLGLAVAGLAHLAFADCSPIVINALDRGWYNSAGIHNLGNDNYFAGDGVGDPNSPYRNWFVFNIPALTQQVVSASLKVYTWTIITPSGSETYELHHVSTPMANLIAGGSGLTNIYNDLGDGPVYGSRDFAPGESSQSITIPLNTVFLSNVMAAAGSSLALGGSITTLDGIPGNNEYVFGNSSGGPASQLLLMMAGAEPLAITTQPQSQTALAGRAVNFSVVACASSTPAYQWQHEGTNIPEAVSSSLLLPNVTSNDAGAYRVIVTNVSAAVTSTVATLTVNYVAPTVSAYFASGPNPPYRGDSVTLCANSSGAPLPALQWQLEGTDLAGQTSNCLYLPNIQTNQSGAYTVVASNVVGVVTSAVVTLVISNRPAVVPYFANYGDPPFAVGSPAYLCASVYLETPYSVQWQFNGTDLADQTNGCLYFPFVDTNHAGFYTLIASNVSGAYTSAPVEMTVFYRAPTNLYVYTYSGSALEGNDLTLCSSLLGSPPLSYQWRFNGTDWAGQTASCLTLVQISTNQAGAYSLVVTNVAGAVTSAVLTITVRQQAPVFVNEPISQTVVEGSTVRINAEASAGPPATHLLQFNGTNLPVPFSYSYYSFSAGVFTPPSGGFTLLDVTLAEAGNYWVIASNSFGMATSQVATLTVTPAGPLDRWTQRNPLPQSLPLLSLAQGNGLWVAVGERGTLLTSADATNWFPQSRRVDLSLRGVAFGGGLFAAVGDEGTVLVSADGTNWMYRYANATIGWNAITYGDGRFVAVGWGSAQTAVLWSSNGVTWDRVAVSSVNAERGVTYGNGLFVAVGTSHIIRSTDGLNWSVSSSALLQELEHVTFGANLFVAVGNNGYLLVSSDGISWSLRTTGTTRRLLGATYGNGKFIAAGTRGTMISSSDANTWSTVASGTPDRLETIGFANGLFVAAGENGTIITAPSGTSWAKQNSGPTRDLDGMAIANRTIIVVGKGGTILTSTDGTHYTSQNASVTNDLHGIAWGNGLWVAVGEPGIILTSSNVVQWTSRTSGTTNSFKRAVFANGLWIVVGTQGSVVTSSNGVDWTASVVYPVFDLNDVAYGNGTFLIAGDGNYNRNGSCFLSTNGVNWVWQNFNLTFDTHRPFPWRPADFLSFPRADG